MNTAFRPHAGEMSIMDSSGHTTLKWTYDDADGIAAAREAFDNLTRKGYSAFGSKSKADAKQALDRFDPTMEELVMVPRTVGG